MAQHHIKICKSKSSEAVSSGGSYSQNFIIDEWIAQGGIFVLDIQHNLESEIITYEIWENGLNNVDVDRVEIISTNRIRLKTALSPDCRFSGTINILRGS